MVTGVNPVDGSTGVPRNARVEIRFSESISAQNLGNVRLLTNGGTAVAVTRTLSDSNRILTLRPTGLLASNRSFTVSVSGVRDTARQPHGRDVHEHVHDRIPNRPRRADDHRDAARATTTPGVGVNVVARVTFSEPIDPLSISGNTFRMLQRAWR